MDQTDTECASERGIILFLAHTLQFKPTARIEL